MTRSLLEGNGAGYLRARATAKRVQAALERMYLLDRVADVEHFTIASENRRETLLVREAEDGTVEMSLALPDLSRAPIDLERDDIDPICQVIEGVSHFVYLSHRADRDRSTTALEMEIQAEVDKWVVLGASLRSFDARSSEKLRERLYERVRYLHDASSELGQRYRVANDAASRFVRVVERRYLAHARYAEMHDALRTFFRHGQEEKMRLGRAA